jgi:predicted  nucleic acid-binding Zn-ribbon protein
MISSCTFEYSAQLSRDAEEIQGAQRELNELKATLSTSNQEHANLTNDLTKAKDEHER